MNCANHPDREHVALCRNCGKPLCNECSRIVGNAVFCEPCLAARLAGGTESSNPYGSVPGYEATATPPPPLPETPNPALAFLLGLIPGVGAMYNGQYAKGIVHLVIFAILVSLSDTNSLFGLFVTGWVFYQAIEAHHTARARRDGTPLPNPFGLNDIGEKLGFGKSWPGAAPTSSTVNTGATYPTPENTAQPMPPYEMPFAADPLPETLPAISRSRFPIGAVLLIVFGTLFFFGSSGWFHYFPIRRIIPFLMIATGVWVFVRKMTCSGLSMANDGSPAYRLRLFRAMQVSVWIVLTGVLFFLASFDILSWTRSWPLFLIVAGLMKLFERSAYSSIPRGAHDEERG